MQAFSFDDTFLDLPRPAATPTAPRDALQNVDEDAEETCATVATAAEDVELLSYAGLDRPGSGVVPSHNHSHSPLLQCLKPRVPLVFLPSYIVAGMYVVKAFLLDPFVSKVRDRCAVCRA